MAELEDQKMGRCATKRHLLNVTQLDATQLLDYEVTTAVVTCTRLGMSDISS